MLKKIRFENFKSFTHETIIDLMPTKSEILATSNIYNDILKGCCFYGSNASGKTTALLSIPFLLEMLFHKIGDFSALVTWFNKEPTMYFEYTFLIDNKEIIYYFEIDRNGIINKETLTIDNEIKLYRLISSCESKITEKKNYDRNDINKNILFLRSLYFNTGFSGHDELLHLFEFLKNSIYVNPSQDFTKVFVFSNESLKEISLQNYLDKYGVNDINSFFKEFNIPFQIKYEKLPNAIIPFSSRLKFKRDNLCDIPFSMESYGNRILLMILPTILTIVKTGGMLVIDEFSSGLHNKLEELLIKYIFAHSTNCQLFFVSHSTNLLKTSLLRPDQVYSTDFDIQGSFIKKFSDEKPRESQNLEKMYLSGVFGGIPLYEKNQN